MSRRTAAAVLSACALAALTPSTASAAEVGPPKVEFPEHCFLVIGPPEGPAPIVVGMTLCLVDWATGG